MCEDYGWRFNSSKIQIGNGTISIIIKGNIYEISNSLQVRRRNIDMNKYPWYHSNVTILKKLYGKSSYIEAVKALHELLGDDERAEATYIVKYKSEKDNEFKIKQAKDLLDAKKIFKTTIREYGVVKCSSRLCTKEIACVMLIEYHNNDIRLVDIRNTYLTKEEVKEELLKNNLITTKENKKMSITVTRDEVLDYMSNNSSYVHYPLYVKLLKSKDTSNPNYKDAQREYRSIYSRLYTAKKYKILKAKKNFFIDFLYPSLKELLNSFGINTISWISKDGTTHYNYDNILKFQNNGREIITCVLENVLLPLLEQKGVKGLKLSKKYITGNETSDIFDYTDLEFVKPEE